LCKRFGNGITEPKQQRAVMEENEKLVAQYIWGETAPKTTEAGKRTRKKSQR